MFSNVENFLQKIFTFDRISSISVTYYIINILSFYRKERETSLGYLHLLDLWDDKDGGLSSEAGYGGRRLSAPGGNPGNPAAPCNLAR